MACSWRNVIYHNYYFYNYNQKKQVKWILNGSRTRRGNNNNYILLYKKLTCADYGIKDQHTNTYNEDES